MTINTKNMVPITEANQNFSRVARMVDENGSAIIMKNNVPRYVILEFSQLEQDAKADSADVLALSQNLMKKNHEAYEALSK